MTAVTVESLEGVWTLEKELESQLYDIVKFLRILTMCSPSLDFPQYTTHIPTHSNSQPLAELEYLLND